MAVLARPRESRVLGGAPSLACALDTLGPLESARDVVNATAALVNARVLDLPLPGHGHTAARFRALSEIAARDLSLARIAEGHADALAILDEAHHVRGDGVYGVWAAEPPAARVEAERTATGWTLRGTKKYCSGAAWLDRALVTAHTGDGPRLFDVALSTGRVRPLRDTWQAVGMAATGSLDVAFEDVKLPPEAAVGEPGFYLSRPGFWRGAVGVAACWFGGALGAYRMLRAYLKKPDEHQLAHLGAVTAACATMHARLELAAQQIDAAPREEERHARGRALLVRHVVEQGCQEVLARVGRASGSSPLAFDRAHAKRAADLGVYLRQHHAERDLAALGAAVLEEDPCR